MTVEQILAIVTLFLFLIAQTAIMAHYFGKLSGKVTEIDNKQVDVDKHLEAVEEKIALHYTQSFEHFVSNSECGLVNDAWENRVGAMLEAREVQDKQNLKDHETLIKRADKDGETLKSISDCLHRLDKRFPD